MIGKKRIKLAYCVFLGCYGLSINNSLATYNEPGILGDPSSWRTTEFNNQWGLGAISAEYAYAKGYTGKGVTIGVFDSVILDHPDFSGKLTRLGGNNYTFSVNDQGIMSFDDTGTLVAGIAAANRNGTGMHGVAYDATLIGVKLNGGDSNNNRSEALIESATRIINSSLNIEPEIRTDADGKEIWLPDGRPDYVAFDKKEMLLDLWAQKYNLLRGSSYPIWTSSSDSPVFQLRAARLDKLVVSSAGDYNNYNIPDIEKSLPYEFPQTVNNFLIVTDLSNNDQLSITSTSCGHTASYCVSAPGSDIYSTTGKLDSTTGELVNPAYGNKSGSSMAASHVTGMAAVLMQRFPYMSADQISVVIKTTATDLGEAGIDKLYGWGKVNLREAIDGPKMFITKDDIPQEFYVPDTYTQKQFIANVPGMGTLIEEYTKVMRLCLSSECDFDTWSNDIAGHGGLTKTGSGTLALSGNNTYLGDTLIEEGALAINGSITSDVYIKNNGTLTGSGTVNSFTATSSGKVAPGNGIGTLHVVNDAVFGQNSRFKVEVASNGHSDKIEAKRAYLNGGTVEVSLENNRNLLSLEAAESLLGNKYTILSTTDGVTGRFEKASPSYEFIHMVLDYQANDVSLGIERTDVLFENLAVTDNERAVAGAVEKLRSDALANQAAVEPKNDSRTDNTVENSHPVYESFLDFTSGDELQRATRQLSGQIHADIAAAQINESRYIRDTATERLRQAQGSRTSSDIKADDNGAWGKLLGNWGHASGNANATGYQTSTYGVLLGLDSALFEESRLGLMTGYTRTSLDGGYQSNAHSDNYHLGLYGDKRFGALALRAGGAYTWHRIETSRSVNYNAQSDSAKAKYHARTGQLFIESGYDWSNEAVNIEPFANLSYTHYRNGGLTEQGGAAALRSDKQSISATASTLGLRADTQWQVKQVVVGLRGELGWQHQYGKLERKTQLMFKGTDASFNVNSVPVSRDGAVVKAGIDVAVNKNASLSLGYAGQLSNNYQDNSVNAGLNWRF